MIHLAFIAIHIAQRFAAAADAPEGVMVEIEAAVSAVWCVRNGHA